MTGGRRELRERRSTWVLGVAALFMVLAQGFGQLAHELTAHQSGAEPAGWMAEGGRGHETERGIGAGSGHGHDSHGCGTCVLLAGLMGAGGGGLPAAALIAAPEIAAARCGVPVGGAAERRWTSAAPRGPPRAG